VIVRRYSEGRTERLPGLAAELVQLNVDLLVATGTPATAAAKQATTTIPILFALVGDPVASGFVTSLARPGGNLTGLGGSSSGGIHGKMVQLLKEALPQTSGVAVFVNPTFSLHTTVYVPEVETAARQLGLPLKHVAVRTPDDLDGAFATIAREKLSALVVLGQPLMFLARARIAKLALDHRVATVIWWREAVEAGVLMSYGDLNIDSIRRLPHYVDRVLRGTKPADLPVEQSTKFYLTINARTAKALGLTIPQLLFLLADQVIE
jgi:putative ABC transport system substrate-binding protein